MIPACSIVEGMAIRDANGHAGVALAEGPEELWPVSGSEAAELPDWRSLCERERERAEAAEARGVTWGTRFSGQLRVVVFLFCEAVFRSCGYGSSLW